MRRSAVGRWSLWIGAWALVCLGSRALLAFDCNRNGAEDTDDLAGGVSQDCNGNGVPDECEVPPVLLGLGQRTYSAPLTPHLLETADLDGDGDLDLVLGSMRHTGHKVSVLLNEQNRRFSPAGEYALDDLHSLALADLNGDGDPDVVTAHGASISILLSQCNGTFSPPERYPPPGIDLRTLFVTPVDMDGDGFPDLVSANRETTTVSILRNRGNGAFYDPVDVTVGDGPERVVPGDFDRDGHVDLATVNFRSGDFSIVFASSSGTFSQPISYPLGGRPPLADLEAMDFNGDGALDLVAVTVDGLSVLMNDGSGSFGDTAIYASDRVRDAVAGDFNADGIVDLAFTHSRQIQVMVNDGEGNFDLWVPFPGLSGAPTQMAVGDYDADGRADIAMAFSSPSEVQILWSGDENALSVETDTIRPLIGCHRPENGCRPHSGNVADLDGDGDVDVVGCNTHPGSFSVLLNDGNGGMEIQTAYTFGEEHPQSVALADVDGDMDIDAVSCDNLNHDIWVHRNKGDGTFFPPTRTPVGPGPINVKLADLDADGDLDAVTANEGASRVSVLFNTGDGTFIREAADDVRVGSAPKAVEAVDLDGDGSLDLAVANSGSRFVSVLWNRGDGTFEEERLDLQLVSVPNHVAAGDLDGDGDVDLVTADTDRKTVTVLRNSGGRTFRDAVTYPTGVPAYSVILVDFNGDEKPDLATANELSSTVSVLLGRGDGTFRSPSVFPAGGGPRFVFAADFDMDGDMDLVTTNREGRSFTLFYNQLNNAVQEVEYLETLCTAADFHWISAARSGSQVERFSKYTLPVTDGPGPLGAVVFQNTRLFSLHQDFLTTVFPECFSGLTPKEYSDMVGVRNTRLYFVGALSRLQTPQGLLYGFSVFAEFNDALESLSAEEVKAIYDRLRLAFHLEPFAYAPSSRAAIEVARTWQAPGFPVYIDNASTPTSAYVAYTKGVAFGRVTILTPQEFDNANRNGTLSSQVIAVLAEAPRDIEGVVAAVVTAEPQGELSHVAVRTNRRGTPNAYISDALEEFTPLDGKLVRFEVGEASYRVEEATQEDAEAWWAANQRSLSVLPTLDRDYQEFATLDEIATMSLAAPTFPVEARFGGKASNLARLQAILGGEWSEYQEKGFAIPMRYYLDFLRSNRILSALDVSREVTYEEYLEELFADAEFLTNPRFRYDALENLRERMRNQGWVDEDLVQQLAAKIVAVFGSSISRVRFRSSSNVEDAVEFNGAGLYDSTSVCAQDDLDGGHGGPSHCDVLRDDERGVARGLKAVWASLWNFRAYEERAFYGIPQEITAMGVLVSRAFPDERVNGVAFTGNPTKLGDRRYVVTAQMGEESVVTPEPGVLAEKDILEVEDGKMVRITRAVASSLVQSGSYVLSDDELRELGSLLWHMDQQYPVDTGEHQREDLLLDVEFKIERTGELAVKQIRPFLLADSGPPPPTFELVVPADTVACGMFSIGREPATEYEAKSQLRLVGGTVLLPGGAGTFSVDLVDEVVIGQDRQVAIPQGQGRFTVETLRGDPGELIFRFDFEQTFVLPSGERFQVKLSQLDYRSLYGVPVEISRVLDDAMLINGVFLRAEGEGAFVDVLYSSCTHETLPLWEVRAEFLDGVVVRLEERFRPLLNEDFGPASVTRADIERGIGRGRETDEYWDLVYSAIKHNEHVVYWAVLDPPMIPISLGELAYFVELIAPIPTDNLPAKANYLRENFEVIAPIEVKSYTKESLSGPARKGFRRGDCTADGAHDIADAIAYASFMLSQERAPDCLEACDVNGDSKNDLSDAVSMLDYLFRGGPVPEEPFPCCGPDPDPENGLGCEQRSCQ